MRCVRINGENRLYGERRFARLSVECRGPKNGSRLSRLTGSGGKERVTEPKCAFLTGDEDDEEPDLEKTLPAWPERLVSGIECHG